MNAIRTAWNRLSPTGKMFLAIFAFFFMARTMGSK